ncbi:GAP family protein [Mycolicibacterium brisbanense]|uniref:GAP family protein n=1 Tax=Mycolicibacterium brisbanense TaxID=146020 RepID=UPI0007C92494|nr:GAP family protein [Mycolicibacterium brisbanense]MCV7160942.1 GAP family protein [Mycolicibacterium brisbanense]
MWSSVLGLALMGALNPVRLGVTLLLISRQRPAQNLLVFWSGCLVASVLSILAPLIVMHFTPGLDEFTADLSTPATNSSVGHFQIGFGAFALTIAALLVARSRQGANAQIPGTSKLILALNPGSSTGNAGSGSDGADVPSRLGSAARRLVTRARNAWENGSLWVAFVIGLAMGPAPEIVLLVLATILTSGAAIGAQLTTAAAYIVGVLGVVEIVLVSHLLAPARTEAVLRRLRGWALAHRQQILAVIFTVIGVSAVLRGMGLL